MGQYRMVKKKKKNTTLVLHWKYFDSARVKLLDLFELYGSAENG